MIAAEIDPVVRVNAKHILIVDDEVETVSVLKQVLSNKGYRVSLALDGNEGIAIIEFDQPDLVILDIAMPKRSGLLLLEYLREELDFRNPVIMLTGVDGRRHSLYAKTLGADDFVRKPYAIDDLVHRVERLVANSVGNSDT